MSELVFSNIIEFIYAIYDYKASKNERIFELEHLRAEIIENGYRGNKRNVLSRISYLINQLNKRGE
ncbi:unnamed protein product [marine sediment metagenome]|uniref:Uncharacterized protein n=1 Tax=marine sediment metagenome TaxID=412755 RepID=X1HH71_9ZZZZ